MHGPCKQTTPVSYTYHCSCGSFTVVGKVEKKNALELLHYSCMYHCAGASSVPSMDTCNAALSQSGGSNILADAANSKGCTQDAYNQNQTQAVQNCCSLVSDAHSVAMLPYMHRSNICLWLVFNGGEDTVLPVAGESKVSSHLSSQL